MSDKLILTQKQIDSFWSHVDVRGADECWNWQGATFKDNKRVRGQVRINRKIYLASRVAFLIAYGHFPVPNGLHSCDNPLCVNPKHIHEGTHQDNMKEKAERGRVVVSLGEQHGLHKLSDDQVQAIRDTEGTQRSIAEHFGVSQPTVSHIKSGKTWRHTQ